jgi:hypothetical protein
MSVQCKLIDMTDFSPEAKRPNLPKLYTIVELLVCVDNLINLSLRIFKPGWSTKLHASKYFYTAIKMKSKNAYNKVRTLWNDSRIGRTICCTASEWVWRPVLRKC